MLLFVKNKNNEQHVPVILDYGIQSWGKGSKCFLKYFLFPEKQSIIIITGSKLHIVKSLYCIGLCKLHEYGKLKMLYFIIVEFISIMMLICEIGTVW